MRKFKFVVITGLVEDKIPLYHALRYRYKPKGYKEDEVVGIDDWIEPELVGGRLIGTVLVPAFRPGEILICNEYGISIPDMRKPQNWGVRFEEFDNLEDAVKRAIEVTEMGSLSNKVEYKGGRKWER